jgi:hypothetical protein
LNNCFSIGGLEGQIFIVYVAVNAVPAPGISDGGGGEKFFFIKGIKSVIVV